MTGPAAVRPPPAEEGPGDRVGQQEIHPARVDSLREHRVVPPCRLLDRPAPRRVGRVRKRVAGGDVDRVHAVLLGPLAELHRFVERVALPLPGIKGVAVVHGADLDLEVKSWADLVADRPDDLVDEPIPVPERAAVIVLAVVDPRAEELGDQVAVGAVQLDAVEPRRLRPAGPLGEVLDRLLDLLLGHRLADDPVERVGSAGRALGVLVFVLDSSLVLLPARVAELHDELAAVLVDPLAELLPERDLVVVVDHGVVDHDPAADGHRGVRR